MRSSHSGGKKHIIIGKQILMLYNFDVDLFRRTLT